MEIKAGYQVRLRQRVKDWGAYFSKQSRGTLPKRRQPPLDEREALR